MFVIVWNRPMTPRLCSEQNMDNTGRGCSNVDFFSEPAPKQRNDWLGKIIIRRDCFCYDLSDPAAIYSDF